MSSRSEPTTDELDGLIQRLKSLDHRQQGYVKEHWLEQGRRKAIKLVDPEELEKIIDDLELNTQQREYLKKRWLKQSVVVGSAVDRGAT